MKHLVSIVIAGAGLCMVGTTFAHSTSGDHGQATVVTSQSKQSKPDQSKQSKSESTSEQERHGEQAKQSQETPAHTEFGGDKNPDARSRQHPQYPESAQHLGPQEEEQGQGSKAGGSGKPRPGHEEKSDAISGVGR
jgi:hypothetical protein